MSELKNKTSCKTLPYLRRGGDLLLGGDHLLGDGVLRRRNGDQRDLLYEATRRGDRDRERLRLSRLRDLDLEYDRDRERDAEDLDLLRLRPLSRDRLLSLPAERDLDFERELERSLLQFYKESNICVFPRGKRGRRPSDY